MLKIYLRNSTQCYGIEWCGSGDLGNGWAIMKCEASFPVFSLLESLLKQLRSAGGESEFLRDTLQLLTRLVAPQF